MRRWLRRLGMLLGALLILLIGLAAVIRLRYGGGSTGFPERNTPPLFSADVLETVADLEMPPGNIAVSADGRVFVSLHPEARPEIKVAELIGGRAVPYPTAEMQRKQSGAPFFDTVLSLRIDRSGRLWTLDNAEHGLRQPRLLGFELATGRLVHHFDFPSGCAPLGSHLNDFQVSPDGRNIFIADASIFGLRPALVLYDVEARRCRRLLEGHRSVQPDPWIPIVQGRKMRVFGLFTIQPGVDSIALDPQGEWLYFAAVTAEHMYRARAADLLRAAAEDQEPAVEIYAEKTMSDGISADRQGNLYLSDPESSSIVRLGTDRRLQTLVKDAKLRWPDGFSFGPDGWLYVTCSALQQVIGRLPSQVRAAGPFQVYRFRPGAEGVPGH
jgi:sugar lactone lactonase YvrE